MSKKSQDNVGWCETGNNAFDNSSHLDAWYQLGAQIERARTAPPALENTISSDSIFAFQTKYTHLFGDIRCEQDYESFYYSYPNPSKLPQPLEKDPFFVKEDYFFNEEKFGNELSDQMANFTLNDLSPSPLNDTSGVIGGQRKQEYITPIHRPVPTLPQTNQSLYSNLFNNTTQSEPLKYSTVVASNLNTPNQNRHVEEEEVAEEEEEEEPQVNYRPPTPGKPKRTPVKYNSVKEVIGKIYSLSKDQYGCRFLQKKLEENNIADVNAIFAEVYEHIVELMTDPFGNYLCQKLVEYCDDRQKTAIIGAVSGDLVSIATNMHGTRAVQKLIECLSTQEQIKMIINALKGSVVKLIRDLNGNHVIQRCLQKLSYEDKQFIYDAVAGKCVEVATHKHGCCVLQRCIDYASEKQRFQLIQEIVHNALALVQNAYGNYVVQYVMDLKNEDVNTEITLKFLGSVHTLSTNKFSSNVMEQCFKTAPVKVQDQLIHELLIEDKLLQILQDKYGNYVIQTAFELFNEKQRKRFEEIVKPNLHLIRNTPWGKKIENLLAKGTKKTAPRTRGGYSKRGTPRKTGGYARK